MQDTRLAQNEIAREFPPEYTEPLYEVADIFRRYGDAYRASHQPTPMQAKAMAAIERCRTTALGAHVDQCQYCSHLEISYNSCRNRHCPKCRGSQRSAWVDARELEVLPIQYFHIVFTLPHALHDLIHTNQAQLDSLLMQTAAATLQAFAQRHWDARLGITQVLHTWGQTINEHHHVHCIVSGGALSNDGQRFIQAPRNFLFPVQGLSRVFRGKYMAALDAARARGQLQDCRGTEITRDSDWQQLQDTLYQQSWVVYAKQPFADPGHLIRYLGRYVNRIAIANHRLESIAHGQVRFRYHDNRSDSERTLTLTADEFIRRYLTHVLPRGFRRIRYYGFLVNSQRKASLMRCRELLGLANPEAPYIADMDAYLSKQGTDPGNCPRCGAGRMETVYCVLSYHDPPLCYQQAA